MHSTVDLCILPQIYALENGFEEWGSMDGAVGRAAKSGASQRDNMILVSHL